MEDINITEDVMDDITKEQIEDSVEETPPQEQLVLVAGYTIGLKDNGDFVFQLHGENPDLVSLLGCHEVARRRVERTHDANQNSGDALIHKVGELCIETDRKLTVLSQRLDQLSPKKPQNQL